MSVLNETTMTPKSKSLLDDGFNFENLNDESSSGCKEYPLIPLRDGGRSISGRSRHLSKQQARAYVRSSQTRR